MADGLHPTVTNFDNQVVTMKLLAGDHRIIELIAKVVSSNEKSRWVLNPQLLQAVPMKNAKGETETGIGMSNFMVAGDQSRPVEIERGNIMATQLANKDAAEEYIRLTSALITPSKPGLIT